MSDEPKVILLEEDHELCETQIKHLLDRLTEMTTHGAFRQYPRAMQDRITRAIQSKGIEIRR